MSETNAGSTPVRPVSGIQAGLNEAADAQQDLNKGIGNKQKGLMRASRGKDGLVMTAQRIAEEIGEKGVVTIDDVVDRLNKLGLDQPGKKARMWHGKVFGSRLWVCVGTMKSRFAANNARDIKVWVLKSWLDQHGLNGTDLNVSAYRVGRIYSEFKKANPGVNEDRSNWTIGLERLGEELRYNIEAGNNFLYGIPVTLVPGAVGALLTPPRDYVRPVPKT